MDDSNALSGRESRGDAYEQDGPANNKPVSLKVDANHSKANSNKSRPRSPFVENENRRTSSQDLHLTAKGPRCSHDLHTGRTIEYKSGLDTFVFPTPSPRLPTSSPRHSPGLPSRSATPQPLQPDRPRESPRIGMAIGSPSNAPPSWGRSQTADCISTRIQQRPPPNAPKNPPEKHEHRKTIKKLQREKKTSSWKLFSNLFKKSAKPAPVPKDPVYREKVDKAPVQPKSQPHFEPERLTAIPPLSAALPATRPVSSRQSHVRTLSDSQAPPRCESRSSVRTSFTRMLRSPCERTTPSSSPWRGTFFRGEQNQPSTPLLHPNSAIISRTPRLELDLPEPEFQRYSVMFSHLLSPVPSNGSKPSLLERRLSRMPVVTSGIPTNNTGEAQSESSPSSQNSQTSAQPRRSMSIKVDRRRNTSAAPVTAVHRPHPIMRSQTAPMYESFQLLASSPESHAESASHSDTSLPTTPTTLNTGIETGTMPLEQDKEPRWGTLASQPVIVYPSDVMNSSVDHSMDLERQMVQVSVARQVSINHARSRVRRTVSMKRPNMVDLTKEKNRKSEVGILDSVDDLRDMGEDDMPDVELIKEFAQ